MRIATECSGRYPRQPDTVVSTMKSRTRLGDTSDRPSNEMSLLVVSDSHVGSLLATDIGSARVHLITDTTTVAAQAPDSVQTTVGTVTSTETLRIGADATAAVIALRRDREALPVAQLVRTRFEIDDLLVLIDDPHRHDAFDDLATTTVCASACLSAELSDALDQTLSNPPPHT
jgi:Trk K+ transport system NAD-binding subunit